LREPAPLVSLRALHSRPEPDAVLVLRFSALGDVILTSPSISALHKAWPNAKIVYAIKERLVSLVEHNPDVSEIVALKNGEGPWSFSQRLKKLLAGKRVVLLDLHGKIRSRLLRALLPRDWRRVVWTKREFGDTIPVKLALRPYRATMLFADRYHAAVEEAVGRKLPRGELRAFPGPAAGLHAKQILLAKNITLDLPIVGMSPGANWETKRWPAERYGALAKKILESGAQVVVQGSADEREICAQVCAIARDVKGVDGVVRSALDLSGQLDLPALNGLVSLCAAFVANDSGPMHLARALQVPTLAMFGSTDPGMFSWEGHRVMFREGLECAPCSFFGRRRCPRGHFRCMTGLEPDDAWSALQGLLAGGARAPLSA
jgi:heptosyltransferase-2